MDRKTAAAIDAFQRLSRHDEHGGGDVRFDRMLRAVGEDDRHGDVGSRPAHGERGERPQAEIGSTAEHGGVFVADAFDAV